MVIPKVLSDDITDLQEDLHSGQPVFARHWWRHGNPSDAAGATAQEQWSVNHVGAASDGEILAVYRVLKMPS